MRAPLLSRPNLPAVCRCVLSGGVAGWAIVMLLGGCAAPKVAPPTLTAESGAAAFAGRGLQDDGLRRFLADNLGRVPDRWDFEALTWVAFYYHPSLELARAQWATARAGVPLAAERPNPTVTLTPGYNTTREPGISPWFPAINFDFLFQPRGKRAHRVDQAQADAEAARFAIFTAAWQVRSDLRKALADAGTASRRNTLLQTQADLQRRLVALLQQRFEAGGAAVTEVSTARSALLRAEAAAADAQSQAATARARVAAALGVPLAALDGVTLPLPEVPPPFAPGGLAAARRQALTSRPDVLGALAKYRAAQAALEEEIAKQVPDFHLGPGYQWDQGGNKWSIGITFELPVFHRNEAGIALAVARRAETVAQFNVVQAQAIAAIDAAAAAQTAAAAQLEQARRLRAELESQRSRIAQRLALGGADQVEAQSAELDLATAEAAVLDAETAALVAAGQLEDALQVPFARIEALAPSGEASARRRTQPLSP
jgi:outer membrane protein, heavy metal efflux system